MPEERKRSIYCGLIPTELLDRFDIPASCVDAQGRSLLDATWLAGSSTVEMSVFHRADFPDPILYGQLADTINGQIHVLLYILNDPDSPRFDVDRMPDGRPTQFGTAARNLAAEEAAMRAGLTPGQVRRGLRLLKPALVEFESFLQQLGSDLYFVEPLYYHNALIFERLGFAYQRGRRLMERIHAGFSEGGELLKRLDGSTFRSREARNSIRLRSWAIHDGLLGEPFTGVTMYKSIGKNAGLSTAADAGW